MCFFVCLNSKYGFCVYTFKYNFTCFVCSFCGFAKYSSFFIQKVRKDIVYPASKVDISVIFLTITRKNTKLNPNRHRWCGAGCKDRLAGGFDAETSGVDGGVDDGHNLS